MKNVVHRFDLVTTTTLGERSFKPPELRCIDIRTSADRHYKLIRFS